MDDRMPRPRRLLIALVVALAGVVTGVVLRIWKERRVSQGPWAEDADTAMPTATMAREMNRGAPTEVAMPADVDEAAAARRVVEQSRERNGTPQDRGRGGSVKLDLSRAQQSGLEPVVEFLTFLQQKRGDDGHLLFVRYDDLDHLAAQQGEASAEFLSRLDQLGVVVSNN